ncbi:hypothetical protein [Pseudoxanthomonas mexicana]|uniref:hypothetical protein n=1 Tax=Pseudoxanthomonas mexicana TaxID=128785 RepID=UPI00398B2024
MLKLTKTALFALTAKLRLPTETPGTFNEGAITAKVKVKTKEQLLDMSEQGFTDIEYINELVDSVEGLGDENGQPITGDAAMHEVRSGAWSPFLQAAILAAYFEQFGEARVKNSKPSRGR